MQVVYINESITGIVGFELPISAYPLIDYIRNNADDIFASIRRGCTLKRQEVIAALRAVNNDSINIIWLKSSKLPDKFVYCNKNRDITIICSKNMIMLSLCRGAKHMATDGKRVYL
jgi:hypothetical protein